MQVALAFEMTDDDYDDEPEEPKPTPVKQTNSFLYAPRMRLVGRTKATESWWIGVAPEDFTKRAEAEVERMRDGAMSSAVMGIALD
jgi:hypothetical protein